MVIEFKFPDVGEGITEGEVIEWLVKEGDRVELDQPMVEVETDKAVVEIPSPCKGMILEILVKPGEIVQVGQVMVRIQEEAEVAIGRPPAPPIKEKEVASPPRRPREVVEEELVIEVSSPREVSAAIVGRLEEAVEELPPVAPPPKAAPPKSKIPPLATPAVRRLARELNIDLSGIRGTGEDSRILREDLLNYSEKKKLGVPKHITVAPVHLEDEKFGEAEHVPLRGVRRAIAKAMAKSMFTAPQVTTMNQVDATNLMALRARLQPKAEAGGIHLTYLPFMIKAVVVTLKEHPYLNSSLDDESQEIILKKYYNIGFATDTEEGLMVPRS